MTVKFTEIRSVEDRLDLIYKFLDFVKQNINLPASQIKEDFAKTYNLSEYAVGRISSFLWFAGIIQTIYRGFPPKMYFLITDLGRKILSKGRIGLDDFIYAPKWVIDSITRKVITRLILRVRINEFTFWVTKNWEYKVYVESPEEWDTVWDDVIPYLNLSYSVKHRAIMFLETCGFEPRFAGYKWLNLSRYFSEIGREDLLTARMAKRKIKVWRTMIYDPEDRIKVHLVTHIPGKKRWIVDFYNISTIVPDVLPLSEMAKTFYKKTVENRVAVGKPPRNYPIDFVSSVWI